MTRVLLIDDHPIVRQGCRWLLEEAGVEELIDAASLVEGYRLYRRRTPDVVIVDLALHGSGLGGLDLIRRIRRHDARTPILVLSMHGDPVIVGSALDAGATGYVLKDTAPDELLAAFASVRRGAPYLSHPIAVQVAMLGSGGGAGADVTPRELQTLALIAEGKSYARIAEELGVSYKTVANTCAQLKTKLGAESLPELIRMAIEYLAASPGRRGGAKTGAAGPPHRR